MSKTYRKRFYHCAGMRKPRTTSEIKSIEALMADIRAGEYDDIGCGVSKLGRMSRHIPTAYDDIVVAAAYDKWGTL
jgi:hypothetical protein